MTASAVRRAAGVVDVPHLRRQRTCSSSTAACRSGRRRAARSRPARSSARRASSRQSPSRRRSPASSDVPARARAARPRRWSMRGPPTASAARRPSRGRACARATCRARFNVPSTGSVENGRWLAPERIKQAFAAGGVDLDEAGHHQLRLGRDRGHAVVRARRHRQGAQGALRRLMVGMGIARRSPGRAESLIRRRGIDTVADSGLTRR